MRNQKSLAYRVFALVLVVLLAILFTFPLYWIITGSFKTAKQINSTTPVWWPTEWTMKNYEKLMDKFKAPLWELSVPFGQYFSEDGTAKVISAGPTVPAAVRWLLNTVWMAVASMLLTSGGPNHSTDTIMYYIYYTAFKLYRYGYGNAMGVVLMIIIAVLSAIQFKLGQSSD